MQLRTLVLALTALISPILSFGSAEAQDKSIVVASTTSTQDSGPVSYTHLTLPTILRV